MGPLLISGSARHGAGLRRKALATRFESSRVTSTMVCFKEVVMFEVRKVSPEEMVKEVGSRVVVRGIGLFCQVYPADLLTFGARVEIFSTDEDGPDEVICVYEDANDMEREAALDRGRREDVPVLILKS